MVEENHDLCIKKCCFTGYRPAKLPVNVYRKDTEYNIFENSLIENILMLIENNCLIFYSGMAMGFDIIAAETVLLLKKIKNLPIKLVCVIPFKNQTVTFDEFWLKKYEFIIENCDEKIILSDEYFKGCYQKRNEFMVNNCDYVLTWFDGKPGGTRNTIEYARKKGRQIFNLNTTPSEEYSVQLNFEIL